MSTPVFWLSVITLVVLLYFVVALADNILQHGNDKVKSWWRKHIIEEYPYDDDKS